MYNYKLIHNPNKIDANKLLLDIKKLLPKHLNCIPDYSALSILELIKKTKKKNYMLETGVGVSTIALFFADLKRLLSVVLYSIRLTLDGEDLQKLTKALICSSSSLIPSQTMYS